MKINAIFDAAVFIIRLSKEKHDLLHWKLAGPSFQEASAAPNDHDLLRRATIALIEALRADATNRALVITRPLATGQQDLT
jgi:hypothetical protein